MIAIILCEKRIILPIIKNFAPNIALALSLLNLLELGLQILGQIDIVEIARRGELHGKSGRDVHLGLGLINLKIEDMPSCLSVRSYEVEVVSWDVEALGKIRCPDANHSSGGIGKLEDRLILDCISQTWIRLLLLGNAPGLDVEEGPVDPHCIESIPGGQLLIQLTGKLCEVAGVLNRYGLVGLKVGHC